MKNLTQFTLICCLIGFVHYAFGQNRSATFDNGRGAIEIKNVSSLLNNQSEMTISAWVFPTRTSTFNGIVGVRSTCDFYLLYKLDSRTIEARFTPGKDLLSRGRSERAREHTINKGAVKLNQWNHLALTYNGREIKSYLNGELLGRQTAQGVCDKSKLSFFIGKAAFEYGGQIDEVRFWTESRSQEQIKELMNTAISNPSEHPGLALYYPLDEQTGATSIQNKGNATGFNGIVGTGVNFTESTAPLSNGPVAKKYVDPHWQRIVFVNYHSGKVGKARAIIENFYKKAAAMAGTSTPATELVMNTGEYDYILIWDLQEGVESLNWQISPDNIEWRKALVELAGGEEEADAIQAEYNSYVQSSKSELARKTN